MEYTILDPETFRPTANYTKGFTDMADFKACYNLAKADWCCVINVMKYNPNEFPLKKSINDAKLLSLGREKII